MNPAPTLVNDYFSLGFVLLMVAAFLAVVIGVILGRIVNADRFKAMPEPVHNADEYHDTCDLELCDQPAAVICEGITGLIFVCHEHAYETSKWAPLSDTPYNQDEAS